MTEQELQCLLSLSCISIFGPRYDIDELTRQGFYKKRKETIHGLERHLPIGDHKFIDHNIEITSILSVYDIHDADSYIEKMNELIEGSVFSKHMDKLMQLGRIMDEEQLDNMSQIMVDNRPYSKVILEAVLEYELYWPIQGLIAFDVATGVLLLRVGVELGYISTAAQMSYFERFLEKVKSQYKSFELFGRDASIARNLHICHAEYVHNDKLPSRLPSVLSECYYGIWQYIESEFMKVLEL